jgi:hypothetical protein
MQILQSLVKSLCSNYSSQHPPLNTLKLLNAELNPICHLPALLGAHHILHVGRIRVKVNHLAGKGDMANA